MVKYLKISFCTYFFFCFFKMTRNRGPLLDIGEIKCPVGNIDVYQCVLPHDTLKLEWGSLCFFAFFFFFFKYFFFCFWLY